MDSQENQQLFQDQEQKLDTEEIWNLDKIDKKIKDPIADFSINELGKFIEDIDNILEPTETTHRFISQQEIQSGVNGDEAILKYIFQDLFNDELRRIEFFKKLNIPEPEKKFWIK